jgi:putative flippase GtrA
MDAVAANETPRGGFFTPGILAVGRAHPLLFQFALFCSVGVLNTLVDISVYFLLTRVVFGLGFIFVAKAISYIAATLFSFFVNRYWTFEKRSPVRLRELGRFYSTVGLGIFVNLGVLYVVVSIFHLYDIVGVVLAAFATAVWGFSLSKWYVFNK